MVFKYAKMPYFYIWIPRQLPRKPLKAHNSIMEAKKKSKSFDRVIHLCKLNNMTKFE